MSRGDLSGKLPYAKDNMPDELIAMSLSNYQQMTHYTNSIKAEQPSWLRGIPLKINQ